MRKIAITIFLIVAMAALSIAQNAQRTYLVGRESNKYALVDTNGVVSAALWAGGALASGATAKIENTTSTQVIAGTASNYLYLTQCLVTNSDASVGTLVSLQNGDGGTTLYSGYAAAAGGGFSITFPSPLKVPTAGNGLYMAAATTSAEVYVSCSGFKSTVSY